MLEGLPESVIFSRVLLCLPRVRAQRTTNPQPTQAPTGSTFEFWVISSAAA